MIFFIEETDIMKNMKKLSIFLVFISLISLVACGKNVPMTTKTPQKVCNSYVSDVNSMDDIVRYSTNIVEATLTSTEDFDGFVNVYTFEVITDYTKNTPNSIHMYDEYNSKYVIGHTYYLFLCKGESALYPHTIYTTVVKDLIWRL